MNRRGAGAIFLALVLGAASLATGRTEARFTSRTSSRANSYSVAPDFVAPTVTAARVADPTNGPANAVRQCRFYYAYAQAADTGNPASGVASVVADLHRITAGLFTEPLSAGVFSLDGVSYGYRSRPLLATAATGDYTYDLTSTDLAANSRIEAGFAASVAAGSGGVAAVFLTGLEQGVASAASPGVFDTVIGAGVSADGTGPRHGLYSLRVAPAGAAAYASASLGGSAGTAVVRFAVLLASPPAVTAELFGVVSSSGSTASLVYDAATGRFGVRWGADAVVAGTVAPAGGMWHVVDMRVTLAGPRLLEWRIDGIEQPPASSAEPASTVSSVGFGTPAAGVTYTARFDDAIVSFASSDYPIGNGKVLALALDGAGNHDQPNRFRNDDGTQINATSWARLDEVPGDATTDYVKQTNSATGRYLEFTFADTSEPCINAVGALLAYHSVAAGSNDGKASIFNGRGETVVYGGDMGGTALRHARVIVSAGTGPWTAASVGALVARVGYSGDVNPNPAWDALLLEYDVPLSF